MRITKIIIAILFVGILLTLVACAPPAPTPPPTQPTPPSTQPTPPSTQPTPPPTQPTPPPTPPTATGQTGFVLSNLGLDPNMPDVGEDVIVSVKVTNTGGQQGTYKVVVKVNDVIEGTLDVSLAAGASQIVNVPIKAPSKEGTFIVTVGDQKYNMLVMAM